MKRFRLLGAVALTALASGKAWGQASVPLPQPQQGPSAPIAAPDAPEPPPATSVPLPTVGQTEIGEIPIGRYGRPDINPYDRDVDLTVPLTYRDRVLGELPVRLTFDDQFFVETEGFLRLIRTQLSDAARDEIAAHLQGRRTFTREDLEGSGVSLDYDPSSLSIVVLRIDPEKRALEVLFAPPPPDDERPDILPAGFSAYLNINAVQAIQWEGETRPPSVSFNGAARWRGVVLEADAEMGQAGGFSDSYRFERNYVRLVYDEASSYRRWLLGDLQPETRGQQSYVQIGGVGVVRQRQQFNQYRSAVLQANRQLVLQRDSTVRFIRNGVLYRELRLDAGSYDFSSLPLLSGSNDLEIEVRDNTGFVQNLSYQSYLDPIDLVPGDFEYGAYIGPTSERFGRSPDYTGPVAFSGFFRKAFLNAPAIGVGLQATRNVQTLTGQTQFVIANGARILLDGAASNGRDVGQGFAVGIGFDQVIDRSGMVDSFTLRADYTSSNFAGIGNITGSNPTAATVTAQYTRSISRYLTLLANGSYVVGRDGRGDSYRIGASVNYRINREWSLRTGVDYTRFPANFTRSDGFGVFVSLVFQPSYRDRAEARYQSNTDSAQLSYLHSGTGRIGSIGYGALLSRDDGPVFAQAFADYIGNRFDASVSHAAFGNSISRFGDGNVTSFRVGTSLAFADGAFGVGRRISDSFAVLYPHPNLRGRSVVAGQSLAASEYLSKSGALGGAVNNFLTSYIIQSVQYDIQDPPAGYDVGPGVIRVRPPYRSGYALRIGTDAFVSTIGTLLLPNGQPVSLAAGRVTPLEADAAAPAGASDEPISFFTNSIGRFAIANLRPGIRYRVELYGSGATFEFVVPDDTTGLVDLQTVSLTRAN